MNENLKALLRYRLEQATNPLRQPNCSMNIRSFVPPLVEPIMACFMRFLPCLQFGHETTPKTDRVTHRKPISPQAIPNVTAGRNCF